MRIAEDWSIQWRDRLPYGQRGRETRRRTFGGGTDKVKVPTTSTGRTATTRSTPKTE